MSLKEIKYLLDHTVYLQICTFSHIKRTGKHIRYLKVKLGYDYLINIKR